MLKALGITVGLFAAFVLAFLAAAADLDPDDGPDYPQQRPPDGGDDDDQH